MQLIEKNLDKVSWHYLSRNPNAIHLLERNMDKINWDCLTLNPNAIHLLENNIDKIDWAYLSENTNAIHLCFTYDYADMKLRMQPFAEELARRVFHPVRLMRVCEKHGMEFEEYMEIIG